MNQISNLHMCRAYSLSGISSFKCSAELKSAILETHESQSDSLPARKLDYLKADYPKTS